MMSDEQNVQDSWIEWRGGDCPVPGGEIVMIKIRSGEALGPEPAENYDWHSLDEGSDIMAYRVMPPASPAADAPSIAPADTHSTIVTRLHIVPSGETLDSENALSVSIVEGGATDYVEIERGGNNGLLQIDASEWPRLRDAVDQIVKNVRG